MSNELVDALANMKEQETIRLAQQMLDRGTDPKQILEFIREARPENVRAITEAVLEYGVYV